MKTAAADGVSRRTRSGANDLADSLPLLAYRGQSSTLVLVGLLFAASAGTVEKYLSYVALPLYFLGLLGLVPFAFRYVLPPLRRTLSERRVLWLAVASVAVLTTLLLAAYPAANSGSLGNPGTDRDDAANLGARQLIHLDYPYEARTYVGNPISQLPGALLMAIPFVLIGNSAYQNIFWIASFYLVLRLILRDSLLPLFVLWLAFIASPTLIREFVTGGDLITNAISVLIFTLGVLQLDSTRYPRWLRVMAAVALGISISSRANLLLVLPLLFGALARREGFRTASRYIAIASGSFLAVTLPFYLARPSSFSPLTTAGKFGHAQALDPALTGSVPPAAEAAAIVGAVGLTLALSLQRTDGIGLLRNCAIVQAFLVGWLVVVVSLRSHGLDLRPLADGYGLLPLLFGLAPAAISIRDAVAQSGRGRLGEPDPGRAAQG